MERSSGKRGTIAPNKGKKVGLKNTPTETDQNAKFCNRIGCNGRIKYGPNHYTQTGSSEKDKQPKSSSSSSNGNEELPGDSLRAKPSFPDSKRKTLSQLESDQLESIQSGDVDARELVTRHRFGSKNKTGETKIWSSSNIHSQKVFHHKSELSSSKRTLNNNGNSNSNSNSNSNGSNINNSSSSTSSSSGGGRYCLRKLHSSSSSESKFNGKNEIKKENLEVESGSSLKVRRKALTTGISISGSGRSSFASGDSKNAGSVKTGRPVNTNNIWPRLNVSGPQLSLNRSNSCSLSSGEQDVRSTRRPSNVAEVDLTRLMNIYNTCGITEVLLALNRMEEYGELTHEQALALESNFSPSPLNQHDQHGDMRLDIDNMSYEELLALGEMIGTVSTALSDETLLKCVKRSIYAAGPSEGVTESCENGDGNKCSICQDEYVVGDETGELVECQHQYHLICINQWLQLKNWCPVCKTAAAPQKSES